MSEEYSEFRRLLKLAIGDSRKQAEFARESGIAAPQLNRMLNQKEIGRPFVSTLKKIAGHAVNGVMLKDLLSACGYSEDMACAVENEACMERKEMDIDERAKLCHKEFMNGCQEMLKTAGIYDGVFGFAESAAEKYCMDNVSISVGREIPVKDSRKFPDADMACPFGLSITDDGGTAEIGFGLYYCMTKKDKIVPLGIVHDMQDLLKIGSITADSVMDCMAENGMASDLGGMDFVCYVTKRNRTFRNPKTDKEYWHYNETVETDPNGSAKDRLMRAIFGSKNERKRISTVEGMGFYTDGLDPEIVREFFRSHKDSFCRTKEEEKAFNEIVMTDADLSGIADADIECNVEPSTEPCWQTMICTVMMRETGIRMEYWEPNEDERKNWNDRPAIMLSDKSPWLYNEAEKDLSAVSFLELLDGYAVELHCEAEDCCFIMEIDDTALQDVK